MRNVLLRLRFPALAFLLNRALTLIFAIVNVRWIPGGSGRWSVHPPNVLVDAWYRWDSEWYVRIARDGYTNIPNALGERDVVFFPLFPLAMRAMAKLTDGNLFVAGFVVSHVALFFALLLLFELARDLYNERAAKNAIILLLCGPYAFFYSALYTESLYLFLTVATFYCAHRRWWFMAAVSIALAGAARTVGVLAGVGVLLLYLQNAQWRIRNIRADILWLPLGGAGLAGYVYYLQKTFGEPWSFATAGGVTGWGADATMARAKHIFLAPLLRGQIDPPYWLTIATLLTALVCTLLFARRMGLAYAIWTFVVMAIYCRMWVSSGRYVSSHFPLFMAAGEALRRRPDAFVVVAVISAVIQALALTAWAHGHWVC